MRARLILSALLLATATACEAEVVTSTERAIDSSNALTSNALTSNALTSNALTSNALTSNALTSNALTSNALTSNALTSNALTSNGLTEGELARQVLRYVYSCAAPAGAVMELVVDGVSYGTFAGELGLAEAWATEGGSCGLSCQRWVSACVLARTNKKGIPVAVSLRGPHPALQVSAAEAAEFPLREGAFYGNIFGESFTDYTGTPSTGPIYDACAAEGTDEAFLLERFCSMEGGGCPFSNTGACSVRCLADTGAFMYCSDFVYGRVGVPAFDEVITVYLREPFPVCGNALCESDETATACPEDCVAGWQAAVGSASTGERALATAADAEGNVYVAGELAGAFGADAFVAKYSPSGAPLWTKTFTAASARALAVDAGGNVIVAGAFGASLRIDGIRVSPTGMRDALIVKLSPSGTALWAKALGGASDDDASAVAVDAAGNVYVSGTFQGSVTFAKKARASAGQQDAFLAKYSATGGQTWLRTFGGTLWDRGLALALAPDGGFVLAGTFSDTVDFGTGPRTSVYNDLFLLRLDATGAAMWVKTLTNASEERVAVAVDADGSVLFAGDFGSMIDLGAGPLWSAGCQDVFLARYAADGALAWAQRFGSSSEDTVAALARRADTTVLVGSFNAPADYGAGTLMTYFNQRRVVVAAYDAAGAAVWSRSLGRIEDHEARGAAVDAAGRVLIAGQFVGKTNLGVGADLVSAGGTDGFVVAFQP